jgi:hypothetical protein
MNIPHGMLNVLMSLLCLCQSDGRIIHQWKMVVLTAVEGMEGGFDDFQDK